MKVRYAGGIAKIIEGKHKGKYLQPDGKITTTPTGRKAPKRKKVK